ncbi:hypothetical protein [Mucilaginibacter sp.]|uniref:hypothetical protein n=1 Tax=Mucilaginibacter sp. TaxID=1882438 RepID=UPI0026106CE6|nr:hypothetical protein [Mucilaginibacter sp.]MDB5127093.1 hypothetical protein [Mucilaginibacter sp.]
MKLKEANLNVSALADVDQLIESMLVDKPVIGGFISFIMTAVHDVETAAKNIATNVAHDVKTAATNIITNVAHDVKTAATYVAHDAKTAATRVAHFVTANKSAVLSAITAAVTDGADGAALANPPKTAQMTKNIASRLKNNSVEALTLQQLLMIRKEALN